MARILIVIFGLIAGLISVKLGALAILGVVASVCAISIILAAYERSTYIIAFYVILDYVLRTFVLSIASIWDDLFLVGLFVLWGIKFFVSREISKTRITPIDIPLFIFYAASIFILLVNSPDIAISIEGFRAVIQYTFWFFVMVQLFKTLKDVRVFLKLMVFSGAILGLHGVMQWILKVPMPSHWVDQAEASITTRVFSIIGSPNILGSLMALLIPIAVSLAFVEQQRSKKIYFVGCSVLMGLCLVFTYSRGAWLGFAIAAAIYVFAKDKRLIVPFVLAVIAVIVFVPSIGSRISYMLSSEYIESSLRAGRLTRWIDGWAMFMENFTVGKGLGHFGGAVAMNNKIPGTFYMDNYYLKTAVEMGIVGISAFVLLMYSVFSWTLRTITSVSDRYYKEISIGLLSGLSAVMVHNLVENVFETPLMLSYFWMLVACVMCIWLHFYKENASKAV